MRNCGDLVIINIILVLVSLSSADPALQRDSRSISTKGRLYKFFFDKLVFDFRKYFKPLQNGSQIYKQLFRAEGNFKEGTDSGSI